MKCPNAGNLQTYVDRELDDISKKRIENHISKCRKCEKTLRDIIVLNSVSSDKIFGYAAHFNGENIDNATPSFDVNIYKSKLKKGVYYNMKKYMKYISVACLVLLVTTCFTFQPIRAKVSYALSIFRAKDVKALDISLDDIQQIQNQLKENVKNIDTDKFGKINTSGGEKKWLTLAEVNKISDFKVLLPSDQTLGNPGMYAYQPTTIDLNLNVENVNKMISSLGVKKLFPQEVNGKTFTIKIPSVLQVEYTKGLKTINILETSSPEIIVPEGVDADQLYESLVDLPVLPDSLKQKLKSIDDWKQTVYFPVVEKQTEVVTLSSGEGYIVNIGSTNTENPNKGMMWFTENTFYFISGDLTKAEFIDLANSMR